MTGTVRSFPAAAPYEMLARYNPQALFFRDTLLRGNRIRGYVHLEYRILQIWVAEIVMPRPAEPAKTSRCLFMRECQEGQQGLGSKPARRPEAVLRQPICSVALTPRSASSDKIAGQPPSACGSPRKMASRSPARRMTAIINYLRGCSSTSSITRELDAI